LSATFEFRFRLPMVNVLTKADALTPEQLAKVMQWAEEPGALSDAVSAESPTPDAQLSTELFRALESMGSLTGLVPTSAKDGTGLEAFYQSCQRVFGAGEDLEPSHDATNE
jgi:Conserved hypothetical ATP binding protein